MDAYVINLDRRPDRLERVSARFGLHGVDPKAFVATDARTLADPGEFDLVPNGILACWKSHERLLESIADGSEDFALVLEDDAVPDSNVRWLELLERTPEVMSRHQLGFLQLGFVSWQFGLTRPGILEGLKNLLYRGQISIGQFDAKRKFVVGSALSGTHAYVVSRTFARKVRGINDPCWTGADGLFMRMSSMSGTDGMFPGMARLKSSIVEQESRTEKSSKLESDVS